MHHEAIETLHPVPGLLQITDYGKERIGFGGQKVRLGALPMSQVLLQRCQSNQSFEFECKYSPVGGR